MVSSTVSGSKIFLAVFTLFIFLLTVNQAFAQGEILVTASFDSPYSNLAILHVQTPEPAICKYDVTPQMIQFFEQTGDLEHEQRVVIRESMMVYVQCNDLNGQTYEMSQLKLQAPQRNPITANVINLPPSSPNYVYLLGLLFITTLLMYTVAKPKKNHADQTYRSLPSYTSVNTHSNLTTLSTQALQTILQQAHKEIDTQHFQESITKYRYLLNLIHTHRISAQAGEAQHLNQKIQSLYYKLNLYNQLLFAHKYWTRNNKTSLQQTLSHIQKNYNTLRYHDPSSLLRNAYKSYVFYEQYLKRTR